MDLLLLPLIFICIPFIFMIILFILIIPLALIEEHYRLKRLEFEYKHLIYEDSEDSDDIDELEIILDSLIKDGDNILYCLECQRVFIDYPAVMSGDMCTCTYSSYYTFSEIKKIINEHEDYKKYADYDIASYFNQLASAQEVYDKYEKFNEILGRYLEEED